jgi:hypothetical protein
LPAQTTLAGFHVINTCAIVNSTHSMPKVNAISNAWNPITKPLIIFMCNVLQFAVYALHHLKALPA